MARLLLGVTGGIAAYKALELVRLATAAGHSVRVLQTTRSQEFVGRASFAALTGAPVVVDEFERDPARGAFPDQAPPDHDPLSHLELVANADAYLIAPASANTIAKLATGLADNLVSTAALAATCPVIVAPAMNHHMWENAATRANIETLRARGVSVLEPGTGRLASKGEWGSGRPRPKGGGGLGGAAGAGGAAGRRRARAADDRPPGGGPRPRHRRRHARADRQRPLCRQPLERADGLRPGRRGRRPRRAGHGD